MTSRTWMAALGLGAMVMAATGGYVMTTTLAGGFDSDKWKALRSSSARENPRAGMVGDLKTRLRPGMSREDVVALLGEPETTQQNRYVYALGASAFGVDYEYLTIEFDAAGKLVRHAITRG